MLYINQRDTYTHIVAKVWALGCGWLTSDKVSLYTRKFIVQDEIKMKVTDILKCAKAGISTEDVKAIQALDNVSVDDALELIKAGYKADEIKGLLDNDTPPEEPKEKEAPSEENPPKEDEEKKKLQEELDKAKKDLEKAQIDNSKKDFGGGEKPDPEQELIKLFAEL